MDAWHGVKFAYALSQTLGVCVKSGKWISYVT